MYLRILNETITIEDPIFGSIEYDSQNSKRFSKKIIVKKYGTINLIVDSWDAKINDLQRQSFTWFNNNINIVHAILQQQLKRYIDVYESDGYNSYNYYSNYSIEDFRFNDEKYPMVIKSKPSILDRFKGREPSNQYVSKIDTLWISKHGNVVIEITVPDDDYFINTIAVKVYPKPYDVGAMSAIYMEYFVDE